ncbi:hypothetical protein LXA43DRAFT_1100635 [Ganoderma leucocontextum]|nr:hypothetical protein LXA43DRAFT_1100635 [Ganoderma leucocontextum]
MHEDTKAQIIIATSMFMVGIDIPNIEDVVILGALQSADEHVQWEGHAGRNPELIKDARCITYVTPRMLEIAQKLCNGEEVLSAAGKRDAGKKPTTNRLYDNPLSDPPCSCLGCSRNAASSILASPSCCCSGPHCSPKPTTPAPTTTMPREKVTNPISAR